MAYDNYQNDKIHLLEKTVLEMLEVLHLHDVANFRSLIDDFIAHKNFFERKEREESFKRIVAQ